MLGGLKRSQALRCSSIGTDLPKAISKIGSIDDYIFRAPGAAPATGSISENSNWSAADRDFPQFSVCEVPDELSIRRPEGERGIVSALQLRSRTAVEGLNVKRCRFPSNTGCEDDAGSVAREHRRARKIAIESKRRAG